MSCTNGATTRGVPFNWVRGDVVVHANLDSMPPYQAIKITNKGLLDQSTGPDILVRGQEKL